MPDTGNAFDDSYDITIVASVIDPHWQHAANNFILTKRQNPDARIRWVMVANNHDPDFEIPEVVTRDPDVTILPGFDFSIFQDQLRPASSSLSTAMDKGLGEVQTRFFVQVDADYYVFRPNWVKEVIDHMKRRKIAVWGSPWHIKRREKWRNFPCSHLTIVDLSVVPKKDIDFQPAYTGYFEFCGGVPSGCRTWLHVEYLKWFKDERQKVLAASRVELRRLSRQIEKHADFEVNWDFQPAAEFHLPEDLSVELSSDDLALEVKREDFPELANNCLQLSDYGEQTALKLSERYKQYGRGPYKAHLGHYLNLDRLNDRIKNFARHNEEIVTAVADLAARLETGALRDRITKPLAKWVRRLEPEQRRRFFTLYEKLVHRFEVGETADCNVRFYQYCKKNSIKGETCRISISLREYGYNPTWPFWKQIRFFAGIWLEQLLPGRLNIRPITGRSVTRKSFSKFGLPDFREVGWEEYFWKGSPFAVHIRSTARRSMPTQYVVQEAWLKSFLLQATGEPILARNIVDAERKDG